MKKVSKIFVAVLCVCLSIVTLTACSKYNALLKAFEKEGFVVSETLEKNNSKMKEELEKEDLAVELHFLYKDSITSPAAALIIEFKSTKELKEKYNESETLKGFVKDVEKNEDAQAMYDSLVKAGYANGNCLIVPLLGGKTVTDIVKSVK